LTEAFSCTKIEEKWTQFFLFDRAHAQINKSQGINLLEPPNVRLWLRFLDVYVKDFDIDREAFSIDVFKVNLTHERIPYTLAETLFGTKGSRL